MRNEMSNPELFPDLANRPNPKGHYPRLHKAISYGMLWHHGQDRKYSKTPYICHPMAVMEIVRTVTDDENMLCAAVLHDVVEDTDITLETIKQLFGVVVADLVYWLTDVSQPTDGNRAIRKKLDRQHTAAAPTDAKTIKLADLIHNAESITAHDTDFSVVFMREMELLLGVLTEGDARLLAQAKAAVVRYQTDVVQEALR